jgi:hypothetical protein
MKRQLSLVLAITATLALAACQKQEAATPAADSAAPAESTPAAEPAAAPAPAAEPAAAPADATAAAATVESLGVPECDDYLTKYEACISAHVPAAAQGALKQSLDQTRAGWKQAIAAGGKDSLAAACTQMKASASASLKAYGCADF